MNKLSLSAFFRHVCMSCILIGGSLFFVISDAHAQTVENDLYRLIDTQGKLLDPFDNRESTETDYLNELISTYGANSEIVALFQDLFTTYDILSIRADFRVLEAKVGPKYDNVYRLRHSGGDEKHLYELLAGYSDTDQVLEVPTYEFDGISDPGYLNQWYLDYLSYDEPYKNWYDKFILCSELPSKKRINVAIVDSGFFIHDDFDGPNTLLHAYDVADNDRDPTPPSVGLLNRNHGTNVLGVIGATVANQLGIAGVGSNSLFYTLVKVAEDYPIAIPSHVIEGIAYAAAADADVINVSIGGIQKNHHPLMVSVLNDAEALGAVVVASAGNIDINPDIDSYYKQSLDQTWAPGTYVISPASHPTVLAVAAIDARGERRTNSNTVGSNYGSFVDISAPGSDQEIYTTENTSSYTYFGRTSAAAPQAAGVLGLYLAFNLTEQDFLNDAHPLIKSSDYYNGWMGSGTPNLTSVLCNATCSEGCK